VSSLVIVAEHLGAMHPYEKILTLVLAFGPFLPLAVVVVRRDRAERRADESDPTEDLPSGQGDGPS
jgi:hypothetical protein